MPRIFSTSRAETSGAKASSKAICLARARAMLSLDVCDLLAPEKPRDVLVLSEKTTLEPGETPGAWSETVRTRMAGLDPALEEASADLGASELTTLRKVLLPQLAPGIIGGALLAFVISMDDLVITYFVSGTGDTTLPVFIFGMIRRGVKPEINAIASLILLSVSLFTFGSWYLMARAEKRRRAEIAMTTQMQAVV